MSYARFKKTVWKFYKEEGRRSLPWRKTRDPYKILVSEIMLQQTQVDRVIPKYKSFLKKFPSAQALAKANIKTVLLEWQGLGYNRRALNLKRTAEIIFKEYKGVFPKTLKELVSLPGIGPATAGDVVAFAWNKPAIVIETNIRTVFIHHFFKNTDGVTDKEIEALVAKTLPEGKTREWYYALMDYGSHLKKTLGNNTHRSKHYKKQSPFKGSNRELRSSIVKILLKEGRSEREIIKLLNAPSTSISTNLIAMKKEGLLREQKGVFFV